MTGFRLYHAPPFSIVFGMIAIVTNESDLFIRQSSISI